MFVPTVLILTWKETSGHFVSPFVFTVLDSEWLHCNKPPENINISGRNLSSEHPLIFSSCDWINKQTICLAQLLIDEFQLQLFIQLPWAQDRDTHWKELKDTPQAEITSCGPQKQWMSLM